MSFARQVWKHCHKSLSCLISCPLKTKRSTKMEHFFNSEPQNVRQAPPSYLYKSSPPPRSIEVLTVAFLLFKSYRLRQKAYEWFMNRVRLIYRQHSSAKQTTQLPLSAWFSGLWVTFSQTQKHLRSLTRLIPMVLIGSWTRGWRQSRSDHAHLTW